MKFKDLDYNQQFIRRDEINFRSTTLFRKIVYRNNLGQIFFHIRPSKEQIPMQAISVNGSMFIRIKDDEEVIVVE